MTEIKNDEVSDLRVNPLVLEGCYNLLWIQHPDALELVREAIEIDRLGVWGYDWVAWLERARKLLEVSGGRV